MPQDLMIFEELFLPHLDAAYNLACWLVEKDRDAQIIVQAAYVEAQKRFKEARGTDARIWLLTIVRNTAHEWIRKRRSHLSIVRFIEANHVVSSEKPPSDASEERRKQDLSEVWNRLPIELREILVLHDTEGWSYGQLATALELTAGTVASRLVEARRLCQEHPHGASAP
jgi:RNA polymerase sigma factor (sigma-70 family)